MRRVIGPERDGARLRVRRSVEDFDPYLEVIVEYDYRERRRSRLRPPLWSRGSGQVGSRAHQRKSTGCAELTHLR